MYRVYFDGVLAGSSDGRGLDLISPHLVREEDAAGTFTFIMSPRHPMHDAIERDNTIVDVYLGNAETPTWRGVCRHVVDDFRLFREVECEGILSVLSQSIQRPAHHNGVTPTQRLQTILGNHNAQMQGDTRKMFNVGEVTVTDSNNALYCFSNYDTSLEEIRADITDDLGGFVRARASDGDVTYIDILKESPRECTQKVEFAKNLIDMQCEYDTTNLYTAIIPLGAVLEEEERTADAIEGLDERLTIKTAPQNTAGVDYIYNEEAVQKYGWKCAVVTFDDIHTPSILYDRGLNWLESKQFENIVITANAVDLSVKYADFENFEVSDKVNAVSKPHGMNTYMRITAIDNWLNDISQDTITLGASSTPTLTKLMYGKVLKAVSAGNGFENNTQPDSPITPPDAPPAEKILNNITAVYSGGSVDVGTDVEALRAKTVVTAEYSDGSSEDVISYTITGSIVEGPNTITVRYGGKTATFSVTGAAQIVPDSRSELFSDVNGRFSKVNVLSTTTYVMAFTAVGNIVGGASASDWTAKVIYRPNSDSDTYSEDSQNVSVSVDGNTLSTSVVLSNASRYYGLRLSKGNNVAIFALNGTRGQYSANTVYSFGYDTVDKVYYG